MKGVWVGDIHTAKLHGHAADNIAMADARDPFFLDARAALTAFLWGKGERDEAEGEWEALQQSGGMNCIPVLQ